MPAIKFISVIIISLIITACATTKPTSHPALAEIDQKLEKSPQSSELLLQKAVTAFKLGKESGNGQYLGVAAEAFEKIHQQSPNDQRIIYSLYEIYGNMTFGGDTEKLALSQSYFKKLQKQIRDQAIPPSMFLLWGRIEQPISFNDHLKSEEDLTVEYISLLKTAIKEQPQFVAAYSLLASLYSEQGKKDLALAIGKQALNKDSENPDLLNTLGEIHMDYAARNGCGYDHPEDLDKAIDYSRKAVKLDAKSARIHTNLARAYEMKRKIQLSINEARIAYKLDPDDSNGHSLAILLITYGNDDEAAKLIKDLYAKDNVWADDLNAIRHISKGEFLEGFQSKKLSRYSDTYDYLVRGLAVEQLGKRKGIKYHAQKAIKRAAPDSWEHSLLAFVIGDISNEQLLTRAETSCHRLEAQFYQAYLDMRTGKLENAKNGFNEIVKANMPGMYEHVMSNYFLSQL